MKRLLLLSLLVLSGVPLSAGQARAVVSVLSPLAYGPNCWSSVVLQNLGARDAALSVEGHKGSGALVPLTGSPSLSVNLAPAEKLILRLDVPGEESPEGWVKIRESLPDPAESSTVAVSGETECLAADELTTVAQSVAFPTRDPWLTADVKDLPGRMLMILNTAKEAAVVNACYANGITAGTGSEALPVCAKTLRMQIPPFGTTEAKGESLVLRVVVPRHGATKTYQVDSTVTFGH